MADTQELWASKVYQLLVDDLVQTAKLRDKIRQAREREPNASDWPQAAPNLGPRSGSAQFRLLSCFHLGLPILPEQAVGVPCEHL